MDLERIILVACVWVFDGVGLILLGRNISERRLYRRGIMGLLYGSVLFMWFMARRDENDPAFIFFGIAAGIMFAYHFRIEKAVLRDDSLAVPLKSLRRKRKRVIPPEFDAYLLIAFAFWLASINGWIKPPGLATAFFCYSMSSLAVLQLLLSGLGLVSSKLLPVLIWTNRFTIISGLISLSSMFIT